MPADDNPSLLAAVATQHHPIVFVFDHGGYTIERYLYGSKAKNNDVPISEHGTRFRGLGPDVSRVEMSQVMSVAET
jgi:TPP-dependent 2-oxoacid decarboxylase